MWIPETLKPSTSCLKWVINTTTNIISALVVLSGVFRWSLIGIINEVNQIRSDWSNLELIVIN